MKEMKEEAEEVTKALGLPPEKTFDVMAAMYGGEQAPLLDASAGLARDTKPATTQTPFTNVHEDLKNLLYRLVDDFLNVQQKNQGQAFRSLWQHVLHSLPLDSLIQPPLELRSSFAAGGLGFGETASDLFPVISATAWAITHSSQLDRLPEEAQSRGCSRALSFALARYLGSHL